MARLHAEKEQIYSRKLEMAHDTVRWTLKLLSEGRTESSTVEAAVQDLMVGEADVSANLSILERIQSCTGGIRTFCSDSFIDPSQTQELLVLERCNRNMSVVSNEVKSFQVSSAWLQGLPVRWKHADCQLMPYSGELEIQAAADVQEIPTQIHTMIHSLNSDSNEASIGASEFATQLVKLAPYCTVAAALARRGHLKQVCSEPYLDPHSGNELVSSAVSINSPYR